MTTPVHFIAHFRVDDAATYRTYEQGFFPVLKAHGGRFVTFDRGLPLSAVPAATADALVVL